MFYVVVMNPFDLQTIFLFSCFVIAAAFHIDKFMTFSPPATFGRQIFSHTTSAFFFEVRMFPVHKNTLHNPFIIFIILFGSRNIWAQYVWIPNTTTFINWTLPAHDSNFALQHVILSTIFSSKGIHWSIVTVFAERGTPRYLKERLSSL